MERNRHAAYLIYRDSLLQRGTGTADHMQYVFGKNRNVIKLALKSGQGTRIDGMIFEDEDEFREKMGTSKYITCTYYPVINEYQGYKSLQINIQNYFFVEE